MYMHVRLYTLRQAAANLGLSVKTLRRALELRQLAAIQPGGKFGRLYVSEPDLQAFVSRWRRPARGEEGGRR